MKRQLLTETNRPNKDDIVMLCTNEGKIFCGVVGYNKDTLYVSMFVNDRETEASVQLEEVRWWHLLPLTKQELYSGNAVI